MASSITPPLKQEGAEVDGMEGIVEESLSQSMVALVKAGPRSIK